MESLSLHYRSMGANPSSCFCERHILYLVQKVRTIDLRSILQPLNS